MKIIQANSDAEIEQARVLFREYEAAIEINLCFQSFDQEVATLPGRYALPSGRLLLAIENEQSVGCIALRALDDETCEMKRLYVCPGYRAAGLGRMLVERIIAEALEIGYKRMRLDTLPDKMDQAIALYRSLGFKEIEPYYPNPVAGALFMELSLV